MDDAVSLDAPVRGRLLSRLRRRARSAAPARSEVALALLSAALVIFSFPDFNLWPLAWVGLVPLFLAVARRPGRGRAFLLGLITGAVYFYGSCYWLTHSMIRYGGIPAWVSFLLLVPGALLLGIFPALCSVGLARAVARWGARALFVAPPLWVAMEWARLGVTGQLWNAVGYSQAYATPLIQSARWGGVYLVGFLVVLVNAAVAHMLFERTGRALKLGSAAVVLAALVVAAAFLTASPNTQAAEPAAVVVAVQPNVPMDPQESLAETAALVERHYQLSERGLAQFADKYPNVPRVVIWPESPMYFQYAKDLEFRFLIADFAAKNRASVLFNSQEPAPAGGTYNSAVMVDEEGRLVAQYDKIRLMPFGEYVPLPRWLPGVSYIPTMVGDFTPGAQYTLMPMGRARTGVFICFESAFPYLSRHFAAEGADVLVNISNDGYLGPTPVMRQHLANTVFRAVENNRAVVRVTNTGITAYVTERGDVLDATEGFRPDVRTWAVGRSPGGQTFYTRFGDLFVGLCAALTLIVVALSWRKSKSIK